MLQLAKVLIWALARLAENPEHFSQNQETTMKALNALWSTQGVQQYLDSQEAFLRDEIVKAFLDAKQPRAEFVAGRLHEVVAFRQKLAAAHVFITKYRTLSERK